MVESRWSAEILLGAVKVLNNCDWFLRFLYWIITVLSRIAPEMCKNSHKQEQKHRTVTFVDFPIMMFSFFHSSKTLSIRDDPYST